MNRLTQTFGVPAAVIALLVSVGHAQAPPSWTDWWTGRPCWPCWRTGAASPDADAPEAATANAKPMRSCESLASVVLPNTTIESAAVDPNNPSVCRVTAVTTHPLTVDKVRIWLAIPTANWNGRFPKNRRRRFLWRQRRGRQSAGGIGLRRWRDRHGNMPTQAGGSP